MAELPHARAVGRPGRRLCASRSAGIGIASTAAMFAVPWEPGWRRDGRHGRIGLASTVEGPALLRYVNDARARASFGRRLRVALVYAAADGAPGWGIAPFVERTFAGDEVERVALPGEDSFASDERSRAQLLRADLVLIGPGDPLLAAQRMRRCGARAWLAAALASGTSIVGVSAGAIVLGRCWASWPDPEAHRHLRFGGASLAPCLGLLPGVVLDCHDEATNWEELRVVHELAREQVPSATRFVGLPTGAGLSVAPDGAWEATGAPLVLAGAPRGTSRRARVTQAQNSLRTASLP